MKIVFFAPINAANFNPDLGFISRARLISINFDADTYRWQACDAEGTPLCPAVFGTSAPEGVEVAEVAAAAHIRADIARTLPA